MERLHGADGPQYVRLKAGGIRRSLRHERGGNSKQQHAREYNAPRPAEPAALGRDTAIQGGVNVGDWTALILPASVAVFAIGVLVVLTPRLVRNPRQQRIEFSCPVCQHTLRTAAAELLQVDAQETGFVVRERPEAYGRPLGELKCPKCQSSHVFAIDTSPATFLVTNAVSATARANTCNQCRAPLKTPPWPHGAFDGKWTEAPKLDAKLGLVCSHCGAVACLACCQEASRGRMAENILRCPRCFRIPMDRFAHF